MLQIVYASAATQVMTVPLLTDLLAQARDNNARLGITGFLLYDEGSFLQVLEGPVPAVHHVFSVIGKDPRHTNLRLLSQKNIAEREFGEWAMAFALPAAEFVDCEGYLDYAAAREEFSVEASEVAQMLAMFQEGLLRQSSESAGAAAHFTITVKGRGTNVSERQARFLLDFGRAVALTVPDAEVGVEAGSNAVRFNLQRDSEEGEVEIF